MLTNAIKTAVIEDLKKLELQFIPFYSNKDKEVLRFLQERGVLDDTSIEESLKLVVIAGAKRDYERVIDRGQYPDHLGRPDCFAYAIQNGAFTPKQIRNIPFDHGDTAETFCKHYGKENLLAVLREELINPRSSIIIDTEHHDDCHCC